MSEHTCHAIGCETPVPPERLMCLRHWRMVPRLLQRGVLATYREGQCYDRDLITNDWLKAATAAVNAVAEPRKKVGVSDNTPSQTEAEQAVCICEDRDTYVVWDARCPRHGRDALEAQVRDLTAEFTTAAENYSIQRIKADNLEAALAASRAEVEEAQGIVKSLLAAQKTSEYHWRKELTKLETMAQALAVALQAMLLACPVREGGSTHRLAEEALAAHAAEQGGTNAAR